MNGPHPELFEPLEPPRGGLARLRGRIERDRRWARARRAAYGAAAILFLCAAAWIALGPPAPKSIGGAGDPFRLARIGLGLAPVPDEPMTIRAKDRHRVAAGACRSPTSGSSSTASPHWIEGGGQAVLPGPASSIDGL